MLKKIILLLSFCFLFSSNIARAGVVINEVQIAPIAERFIELYNSSNTSLDLTGWYIQRKTASSDTFSSLVSKTYFENKSINANSYFLIAKSDIANADIVLNNLTLTESNTIQLKNSEGNMVDKIDWNNIQENKSIQKISSEWLVASPTPGKVNSTSDDSDDSDDTNDTTSDSSIEDDSEDTKLPVKIISNKTKIIAQSPAFVGLPTMFKINNTVSSESCGKYYLNFGDGSFVETAKTFPIPQKFSHIYDYVGEYVVNLECYKSYLSLEPDTSDETTIKVVSSDVLISQVGDEKDFFIEISNNTSYEVDISAWYLLSDFKKFVFPKNTIIQAKNKIVISPKITNFSILDKNTLKLVNSEGETISQFSPFQSSAKVSKSKVVSNKTSTIKSGDNTYVEPIDTDNNYPNNNLIEETLKENLPAQVLKSSVNTENNFWYFIGLAIFLFFGAFGAYIVRNHNRTLTPEAIGGDFEIIDE